MLNVHYKIPYKKIQLLFEDLFGYPINESTIYAAAKKCYHALEDSEQIIRTMVASSPVAHADETGVRVEGRLQWLHTASNFLYTYLFIHGNRGKLAMESDKSIIGKIKGWLVHDCWSSYFSFTGHKHAICGAHILRELQGLIDTGQSKWAKTFKSFLMNIYEMPFAQRLKQKQQIESRFRRICNLGDLMEPHPIKTPGKRGRYKRTKGRNLVERLLKHQVAILAFAFNEQVPFTNNLAERDLRMINLHSRKIIPMNNANPKI
jgi:transposase